MGQSNLSRKQIEAISETAAKEALKVFERKKKEKQDHHRDWRLRNTRLLFKNYRLLVKHCEEVVGDLEDYENIIFDPEDLNLQELMKYKARTKKMLNYFDTVWQSYSSYCTQKGEAVHRRCKVIEKLYIVNGSSKIVDLADLYGVDERTIRRDEKKAISEMSIFLFGIDSLEDLANVLNVS